MPDTPDSFAATLADRYRVERELGHGGMATVYLASHLREEGRLAALTGDRDGAIRAYDHYLALRSDPEPALRPVVEAVRAERVKLEHPR